MAPLRGVEVAGPHLTASTWEVKPPAPSNRKAVPERRAFSYTDLMVALRRWRGWLAAAALAAVACSSGGASPGDLGDAGGRFDGAPGMGDAQASDGPAGDGSV